ncbi:aryl-sulfate sulfotransferase [Chloroflexota bacterium]
MPKATEPANSPVPTSTTSASQDASVCAGYTLYSSPRDKAVLIDMDGVIVKEWSIGGMPAKMLSDGALLGSKRNRRPLQSPARQKAGGPPQAPYQDTIEFVQLDWDGKEEWSYVDWDDDGTGVMMSRQHHDFQRQGNPVGYYAPGQEFVENGNTLILAHKNKLVPEISDRELEDDVIYEVDWNGNLTGFEWHAADHFQEFGFDQAAKDNIYRAPQYDKEKGFFDWLHINSMSLLGENRWYADTGDERFSPTNIIISSRSASFVAIVSRATGEIVWRIGLDFSASNPEQNLGQFIGPHHAHMIPEGLPGEGNILVFDNGGQSGYGGHGDAPRYTRSYSRIVEFNPVKLEIVWQYGEQSGEQYFFSPDISSAQRLPNGNTLITDGRNGRIFEVTNDNNVVWEFIAPIQNKPDNSIYRAYRIPPEWVPGNPASYKKWADLYK